MNMAEVTRFLMAHQPLPADSDISEAEICCFDEVRKYLEHNPEKTAVSLLLNAFGEGDGLGVYPLIEQTLLAQDRNTVVTELATSLGSAQRSVRYWCAQFAASFPSEKLVAPLLGLLSERDFDIKYAALTALEQARQFVPVFQVEEYARSETNAELRELAGEVIAACRQS